MLLPVESFLVASDHPASIEAGDSEMVLWPNPTSKFLSRFAVRRRSRATLDLGTGSGILSLGAAGYSDRVIATDLNPRVPSFVTFNARLNGIENIELRMGDGFAPVAGLTFDLILSNPPFFITPRATTCFAITKWSWTSCAGSWCNKGRPTSMKADTCKCCVSGHKSETNPGRSESQNGSRAPVVTPG